MSKIKNLITKFIELSFPIKLLTTTMISIIVGSGFLSFLSEYSTYWYAIQLGVRPPLEGIPYLKTTVIIGSLLLSLLIITVFFLTKSICIRILYNFESSLKHLDLTRNILAKLLNKKNISSSYELVKLFESLSTHTISLIILGMILIADLIIFIFNNNDIYTTIILWNVIISVGMLLIWKKSLLWWISIISSIVVYCAVIALMFNSIYYSKFLKLVNYGGGLNINIHFKEKELPTSKCFLLLRTTKYLTCMKEDKKTIEELPLADIQKISYFPTNKKEGLTRILNLIESKKK